MYINTLAITDPRAIGVGTSLIVLDNISEPLYKEKTNIGLK